MCPRTPRLPATLGLISLFVLAIVMAGGSAAAMTATSRGASDAGSVLPQVPAAAAVEALLVPWSDSFSSYYPFGLPPSWGDCDNDGDQDLPLYRDNGLGSFTELWDFLPLLDGGNYHGTAWCDYDRDGNLDLALLPYSGVDSLPGAGPGLGRSPGTSASIVETRAHLLHNQGNGTFVDVAPSSGMDVAGFGETAVWADFDGDGWPDLFAPYYAHAAPYRSFLYHNNRDGTFTDVALAAGVALAGVPEALKPEGAQAVDYDGDGDLDLYCASHLFRNDGSGRFADVRAAAGLPEVFDEGARFVDFDNDGDLDFYLRTLAGARLFRNASGHFTDVTAAAGLPAVSLYWGDSWADVDNDGDLDLYLVRQGLPGCLMLNRGDGTFVQDSTFNLAGSSGVSAWADADGDGDLDLVVDGDIRRLLRNTRDSRPGFTGSYIRVVVLDAGGMRTEYGATARLKRLDTQHGTLTRVVDGGSGYLTQGEYALHFGVDPNGTYSLAVNFPGSGSQKALVSGDKVPWLKALKPATLGGHTITVYRDGRATLDPGPPLGVSGPDAALAGLRLDPPAPSLFRPERGPLSLRYALPRQGMVRISILDVAGRRVAMVWTGVADPGRHELTWTGRDGAGASPGAGVYLVRLESDFGARSAKFLLVR